MKGQGARERRLAGAVCVLLLLSIGVWMFCAVTQAAADEYDAQEAGHPLKLVAYLAFPIGTLLDYGLMRPAYWLVKKEPFRTLFGYEYMALEDEQVRSASADRP